MRLPVVIIFYGGNIETKSVLDEKEAYVRLLKGIFRPNEKI